MWDKGGATYALIHYDIFFFTNGCTAGDGATAESHYCADKKCQKEVKDKNGGCFLAQSDTSFFPNSTRLLWNWVFI